MTKVRDTLSDVNADWEKRTDAVRVYIDDNIESIHWYISEG